MEKKAKLIFRYLMIAKKYILQQGVFPVINKEIDENIFCIN